jgi:hypothetical protein
MKRFRWLAGKVPADHWFAATVLPQLHVLAWGNNLASDHALYRVKECPRRNAR